MAVRVFGEERDGSGGGEIERADGDEERVAALMLIDGDIARAGGGEDGETDLSGAVFVRGAGDLDFPWAGVGERGVEDGAVRGIGGGAVVVVA